jgi:cytochrome oxidase assembly protein ShyY1
MNYVKIKRVYEPLAEDDGYRILVDRLWPRGVSKDKANIDEWAKEITPSTEIRKEFNDKITINGLLTLICMKGIWKKRTCDKYKQQKEVLIYGEKKST